MQYMLLIFSDEAKWKQVPASELSKLMNDYGHFTQEIVRSGQFRAGGRLQSPSTATTIRQTKGNRMTTDGPFADSKEHLGGYYVVECEHLDEALAIAGRVPGIRVGDIVEVRPVAPTSEAAKTPPAK